jgi:A/G-specific adenine glycosylase
MSRDRTARITTQRSAGAAARELTDAVSTWFGSSARSLPWRTRRNGYRALVSELMLQQTQVARVVPAFNAFMKQFPTCAHLARATEPEVLAAWTGLGYYRRATLLHAAAKQIVAIFNGEVPEDAPALQRLPGVGRYTAGAIASVAFGRREPIVDGNVFRVLSRVFRRRAAHAADPDAIAWAWLTAEALVQAAAEPGVFNEGMMELGAMICTPRAPACDRCPVAHRCLARKSGEQEEIPLPKPATARRAVHHHVVVITRNGRVLTEQRPAQGLWSNMNQATTVESETPLEPVQICARLPVPVTGLAFRERFRHGTSHRDVTFHVYTASTRSRRGSWHAASELSALPLSNPQRRIMATYAGLPAPAAPAGKKL